MIQMKRMNLNNLTKTTLLIFCFLSQFSCKNEIKAQNSNQEKFFKTSLAQWSIHNSIREGKVSPYDFAKIAHDLGFEGLEYVNALYSDVTYSQDKASAIEDFITINNGIDTKLQLNSYICDLYKYF